MGIQVETKRLYYYVHFKLNRKRDMNKTTVFCAKSTKNDGHSDFLCYTKKRDIRVYGFDIAKRK